MNENLKIYMRAIKEIILEIPLFIYTRLIGGTILGIFIGGQSGHPIIGGIAGFFAFFPLTWTSGD